MSLILTTNEENLNITNKNNIHNLLTENENENKNENKNNNENINFENINFENSNENEYNTEKLNNIKTVIEQMDKIHHIEILKILINENLKYNENNNGTFINLTELNYNVVKKLENYIDYFKKQQSQLVNLEKEKKKIEDSFF